VGQVKACLVVRLAHDRAVLANRTIPVNLLPSVLPPRVSEVREGSGRGWRLGWRVGPKGGRQAATIDVGFSQSVSKRCLRALLGSST
jgi:hypothetical protein